MKYTLSQLAAKRQWKTEAEARAAAREYFHDADVLIIHSPHPENKLGDYWVECKVDLGGFVRSWEKVLFDGVGCDA